MNLFDIKTKSLNNEPLTKEEISFISTLSSSELYTAAEEVTSHHHDSLFDMCSIINAKSGKCTEDCKWCAQSIHFKTKIDNYKLVDTKECLRQALHNQSQGIGRFSLVTSGRKLSPAELKEVTLTYETLRSETELQLCASFGLLNKEELQLIYDAGVRRYHCNLETSPEFFPNLCSTHTQEEKIVTIGYAKEVGMEVCSGGIIGMGESIEDRCSLAVLLRDLEILTIPINILMPIPGTPLENTPSLSQEEILQTIALFRLINPKAKLRFSGGRTNLSQQSQEKALAMGVNAAIVGDLLTTIGSCVDDDKELFTKAGYKL